MRHTSKLGFTLVELLVVMAIIGTLVGLLLPAVQSARETARSNTCRNNLRQLQMALSIRETSLGQFPGYINKLGIPGDAPLNQNRASWLVMTFPQIEQTALWDDWNRSGPSGFDGLADGNGQFSSIEILVCPSNPPETIGQPLNSYVANAGNINRSGDTGDNLKWELSANGFFFDRTRTALGNGPGDGAFAASVVSDNRDDSNSSLDEPEIAMTVAALGKGDGSTKTMMLSENLNATHWGYFSTTGVTNVPDAKYHFGFCWEQPAEIIASLGSPLGTPDLEMEPRFRRINGVKEPLLESEIGTAMELSNGTSNYGFPSSYHPAGVNVAFVGGQVVFISDQIDPFVYAQLMTSNQKKSDLENGSGVSERNLPAPADDAY